MSSITMTVDPDAPFWTELRERVAGESGPRLWRSLEELADRPELRRRLEAEFPELARPDLVDRRTLMRLMAASLALGALSACGSSPPPLYSRPQGVPAHLRGRSLVFATSLDLGGYGRGVLVDTHDGRPIRIDGNPVHPASLGAMDVFGQAEILSLYDPDRSRTPREGGIERDWAAFRRLARVPEHGAWPVRIALVLAVPLLAGAVAVEVFGQRASGLHPDESSYGAIVYTVAAFQGFFAAVLAIMALYTVARSLAGRLDNVRRATFDNTALFWHYTTAQGLVGLLIVHGFPRLAG